MVRVNPKVLRLTRLSSSRKERNTMSNEVGKRYVCKKCGNEFIVTKGGKGALQCCGEAMEIKK